MAAKSSSVTPSYCPVNTPSLTSSRQVSPVFNTAKSTAQPARLSLLLARMRTASSTVGRCSASSPGDPVFLPYWRIRQTHNARPNEHRGTHLTHGSYSAIHHVNAKLGHNVDDFSTVNRKGGWQLLAPDGDPQRCAFGCLAVRATRMQGLE